MLTRLILAMIGAALAISNWSAMAQSQPAWNPATLKTACDRNDYDACLKLGLLFAYGQSVAVDRTAAARFLAKACDGNARVNCTTYGLFLQGAAGGTADYDGARAALGKACDAGDGDGCNKLSNHFYYGWGVARDIERSSRLLTRGCELNDGQSCGVLGTRRMTAHDAPPTPEALRLQERACKLNFATSCGILAGWYYAGLGVPQDSDWAYAMGLKACYEGDRANGCYVAGLVSKDGGKRQPKNPADAVALLSKACELKSVGGCVVLSGMYSKGEGVPRDPTKAANYARLACEIDKSQCPAAASSPTALPSPPQQASPSPSNQSLFSIFGVQLGADRFDAVKAMLERNRASFFDYFDGTSALNEATRKQVSRRLVVSDARFPGVGSQGARVWFDFANGADPVLSTVTVLYGPGSTGLQADRIAALTRQYGADDGKGNAAQWHRTVPGADIALFANPQTGAVDERYAYSMARSGGGKPTKGVCPAIKVTVAFYNSTAKIIAFNAGSGSSDGLFNWTVSAGTITSGQGTSNIYVSSSGLASGTTTTVEVEVAEVPACGDQVRKASLTAKLP